LSGETQLKEFVSSATNSVLALDESGGGGGDNGWHRLPALLYWCHSTAVNMFKIWNQLDSNAVFPLGFVIGPSEKTEPSEFFGKLMKGL
jgi:hypothetical protein